MQNRLTAALLLFVSSCVSPPPHVLVTVADDDEVAGNAVGIGYSFSADDEMSRIPLDGKDFPLTFVLESEDEKTESLWIFAYDAADDVMARAWARAVFKRGSGGTARVDLAAACEYGHADGMPCIPDVEGTERGVCASRRCYVVSVLCGNGELDEDEECDDGNRNDNDACLRDCVSARCGDLVVWEGVEDCDEGEKDTTACDFDDGVSTHACTWSACGDGYLNIESGETCDDGNADNSDSCPDGSDGTCQDAKCGDGFVWSTDGGTEQCDVYGGSATCDWHDGVGTEACTFALCGDLYRNMLAGEECDDGTADSALCDYDDGVSDHACTQSQCGDGYANEAAGEACDDGQFDTVDCDFAAGDETHACTLAECGDGHRNIAAGEECDDGAADSRHCDFDDGLSVHRCTLPVCGDGYWNSSSGEECDSGPADSTECDYAGGRTVHQCTLAECGDGYVNSAAGEECDAGPSDSPGCDFAGGGEPHGCTEAVCGDLYINAVAGETCEDGDHDNSDQCPDATGGSCQRARCGDGFVWSTDNGSEECDEGDMDTVTCNYNQGLSCTFGFCGDGYANTAAEGCDDGNTDWQDGCHNFCISSFPYPRALNTNTIVDNGDDTEPSLATDDDGLWIAAWTSSDSLGGAIGTDADIFFARSSDDGATWTHPAPLNRNAALDSGQDGFSQLATDGLGNWIAVWQSNDSLGGTIGTDYDILTARSTDNGVTWTAPVPLNDNASTDGGDDSGPRIAMDSGGSSVVVWASDTNLGGTIGYDEDILLSRSTDHGAVWGTPAPLAADASTDVHRDFAPRLATDGSETWMTVWTATRWLQDRECWDILVKLSRSTDGGVEWEAPIALGDDVDPSPFHLPPDFDKKPQIATDRAGNWVALWEPCAFCPGPYHVVTARSTNDGVNWTASAPVDADIREVTTLTVDSAGGFVMAWESHNDLGGTIGTDGDILTARSIDIGATWTAPFPLNTNAATDSGDDSDPGLRIDGAGNWVAVWSSTEDIGGVVGTDGDILTARSSGTGVTWTTPAVLNRNNHTIDSGHDQDADVATDHTGNWIAVWSSNENIGGNVGSDWDVFIARSTDDGFAWTMPTPLNTNAASDTGDDVSPQVATNHAGNWVVVWASNDALGGTIGTDDDILVARSDDNGATWSAPSAVNSNAATDSGDDGSPRLATDTGGTWLAAWNSTENLNGIGTDDDLLVSRSFANGASWSVPVPLNTNASSDSGDDYGLDLATDDAGTWVVVWMSDDDLGGTVDSREDIFVARSTNNGSTWTAPGAIPGHGSGPVAISLPRIATDRAGHWVVVWATVVEGGAQTIEAAVSSGNGATWTHDQLLYDDGVYLSELGISTDELGNWVVVWGRYSIGFYEMMAVRSTDQGASWTTPGPLYDTGGPSEPRPNITTDGAGNWVISWTSPDDLHGTIGTDRDILFTRFTIP